LKYLLTDPIEPWFCWTSKSSCHLFKNEYCSHPYFAIISWFQNVKHYALIYINILHLFICGYTFNRKNSYSSFKLEHIYTSINFLTHEDIKLIDYGPRTNISFNNFQVLNHVGLKDNLCSTKGFYGQIRDHKYHHIMSIFNINNEQISNKHNN